MRCLQQRVGTRGNRLAVSGRFLSRSICDRLPPVATTRLNKRSVLRSEGEGEASTIAPALGSPGDGKREREHLGSEPIANMALARRLRGQVVGVRQCSGMTPDGYREQL
jgi:hypothetical protein